MEVLVLLGLIVLNGLFAMSEVALLTANRPRLVTRARNGDRLAAMAVKLGEDPTRFLSIIQIGITSIGLLNGIYGEAVLAGPFEAWLESQGMEGRAASIFSTALVVVCVTYVSIVIGEVVPKRLGQLGADQIARLAAPPMRALAWLCGPFVTLLSFSTDVVLKPITKVFRLEHDGPAQPLSAGELRTIVLESSKVLPKKHVSILLNLFDLETIAVDDVMTPRAQIEGVDINADADTLRQQISTAHHRRLAVYDGQLDDLLGVFTVRHLLSEEELTAEHIREVMRDPLFVPSGTPLLTQLQQFQSRRERMCFVVDEYGELMGVVTVEDLVEELVGDFVNQSPLESTRFHHQEDGSWLVEGGSLLRTLNRKLGFSFPLDGPKTLNGLILEHLQDIPEPDTSLKIAGHAMDIVQTQDKVVKAVRLHALKAGPPAPEAEPARPAPSEATGDSG